MPLSLAVGKVFFMLINGEKYKLENPCTLSDLLKQRNCVLERVAVELNGKVIPKADYGTTMVSDSSSVEIVSFVGGG